MISLRPSVFPFGYQGSNIQVWPTPMMFVPLASGITPPPVPPVVTHHGLFNPSVGQFVHNPAQGGAIIQDPAV
jgi:hypothetical protein